MKTAMLVGIIAVPTMFLELTVGCQVRAEPSEVVAREPVSTSLTVLPAPEPQDPVKPAAKKEAGEFEDNAFPPIMVDVEEHRGAWMKNDCLRCHETGVGAAPEVVHRDMPDILLSAKCRTCHVFVPGSKPEPKVDPTEDGFASWAFPPMIPASGSHTEAWHKDDCLLCHEDGTKGAPKIEHRDMPRILFSAKCRTCHVQVRAVDASSIPK